jgi:hypothetical protein
VEDEVDVELGGRRPRDLGVGAGVSPSAVIDVVGRDGATGRDGEYDECCRVGSTRRRAGDCRAGWRERTAGEEFASFVQDLGGRVQRSRSLWRLLG